MDVYGKHKSSRDNFQADKGELTVAYLVEIRKRMRFTLKLRKEFPSFSTITKAIPLLPVVYVLLFTVTFTIFSRGSKNSLRDWVKMSHIVKLNLDLSTNCLI